MERQNDFKNVPNLFEEILKKKWDEIHEGPKVFRYKIKEINKKYLQEKYLIQVLFIFKFILILVSLFVYYIFTTQLVNRSS